MCQEAKGTLKSSLCVSIDSFASSGDITWIRETIVLPRARLLRILGETSQHLALLLQMRVQMVRRLNEIRHTHKEGIPTMATVFEDIGLFVRLPLFNLRVGVPG